MIEPRADVERLTVGQDANLGALGDRLALVQLALKERSEAWHRARRPRGTAFDEAPLGREGGGHARARSARLGRAVLGTAMCEGENIIAETTTSTRIILMLVVRNGTLRTSRYLRGSLIGVERFSTPPLFQRSRGQAPFSRIES